MDACAKSTEEDNEYIYPEELNEGVVNVRALRQEEAAPRAEFVEKIQLLVL